MFLLLNFCNAYSWVKSNIVLCFVLQLQAAPQAFELWANKLLSSISLKIFPAVVAHKAAHLLTNGRSINKSKSLPDVHFRLFDVALQADPNIEPFRVSNCDKENPYDVSLKNPHALYLRQQKVVAKMLSIETGQTSFEEMDMSEQQMPGCGISLVARATLKRSICGGVIADAIGAGNTTSTTTFIFQYCSICY